MMRRTTWALVACGILGAATEPTVALAAKGPTRTARSCRRAIAHAFEQLAGLGFREIDRCQKSRAAGRTERDCTVLGQGESRGTPYRRWEYRTKEIVTVRCPLDTVARASFPLKEFSEGVVAGDPHQVVPAVGATIEASARELTTAASVARAGGGDMRCLSAVSNARSEIARATMHQALRCQRARERSTTTFGPLDPTCEGPPSDSVIREAAGRIAAGCQGVNGPDVGTCGPLPGCVIDSATVSGIALARLACGQCGNGVLDGDEQCDDGNQIAEDGCDRCTAPECGNGRVESGEQCDDGNPIDNDGCTDCLLSVCGDGVVDVGVEACDDGNDVPLDGCTDCQSDPVACSSAGVLATITVDYDPDQFGNIAGWRVRIRYQTDTFAIPGSLVAPTVIQRVRNLTGAAGSFGAADRDLLPSEEAPDGTDDTLQTIFAVSPGGIPPGPYASIRFDCLGAEARASQLTCLIGDVVDEFTNPKSYEAVAEAVHCSIALETAPEQ
jgi:cysteine-rich repeat protein